MQQPKLRHRPALQQGKLGMELKSGLSIEQHHGATEFSKDLVDESKESLELLGSLPGCLSGASEGVH